MARVFPDHLGTLRASYYAEHQKRVARVARAILARLAGDSIGDEEAMKAADEALEVLRDRFDYCDECAREMVADLMRKRYDT
jgi:hypothetical protein